MVPRPKYKAMLKRAKHVIDQLAESPGPFGINARSVFSLSGVKVRGEMVRVTEREAFDAWPYICKDLGLVMDSFGEWTLPGRELL